MKKYFLRYLIFWAPAVIIALFFNSALMVSQVLQWFFAFFMLFGWAVNTGMAAYRYPRKTLSSLLIYLGVNLLIIVWLYSTSLDSRTSRMLVKIGGIFSYTPQDILLKALLEFNIPHEIYITFLIVLLCFIGYLCGLIARRVRPSPYQPRIMK